MSQAASQAASQAVSIVARLPAAMPAAEMKTYWAMSARDWPGNPNSPRDVLAEAAKVPIGYILLKSGAGAVVGGCYWIEREIRVDGRPERAAGLAGVIVVLSALRAGSRVKATLWNGKNDFQTNGNFWRDETEVQRILTGYIGGATAFPIHLLRETFAGRKPSERAVHILILSDDGVTTLFEADEKGHSGWDISRMALERAAAVRWR